MISGYYVSTSLLYGYCSLFFVWYSFDMFCSCCLDQIMSKSFVTPWTIPTRFFCPWDFSGKNTGVGCHFFLQGIVPIQGSNPIFLTSPTLAGEFFTTEPPGKPLDIYSEWINKAPHNGKLVFPLNHSEIPKVDEPRVLVKVRIYMAEIRCGLKTSY